MDAGIPEAHRKLLTDFFLSMAGEPAPSDVDKVLVIASSPSRSPYSLECFLRPSPNDATVPTLALDEKIFTILTPKETAFLTAFVARELTAPQIDDSSVSLLARFPRTAWLTGLGGFASAFAKEIPLLNKISPAHPSIKRRTFLGLGGAMAGAAAGYGMDEQNMVEPVRNRLEAAEDKTILQFIGNEEAEKKTALSIEEKLSAYRFSINGTKTAIRFSESQIQR